MRLFAIILAVVTFLAVWIGCTCKHWGEIVALSQKRGSHRFQGGLYSPSPAGEVASLTARMDGKKLLLSGTAPSEDSRARLLARARELYGEEGVVDGIVVRASGKDVPDVWLKGALVALPLAKTFGFTVAERSITLSGTVPTDKVKGDSVALAQSLQGRRIIKAELGQHLLSAFLVAASQLAE